MRESVDRLRRSTNASRFSGGVRRGMLRSRTVGVLVIAVFSRPSFALKPGSPALFTDQLVYSSTLGSAPYAPGAQNTVADDLITTGAGGCQLAGFEFDVDGNTDGQGIGSYAVDFQLYDDCPGGLGLPIPGTAGHIDFGSNDRFTATFSVPPNQTVTIPRTVWLAVTFNRDHAGWVGGAPALLGYSDDWFYNPLLGCGFSFGGYPAASHASMNARLFVRGTCPTIHAAYHSRTPRRGTINPGDGLRMADDIMLDGACQMVAYDVAVRGSALYDMDLRLAAATGLPGTIIPGTSRSVQHFGGLVKTLHQDFSPPISLPPIFWFTIAANSTNGRTVVSGLPARFGSSKSGYAILNAGAWESSQFPVDFGDGALEVTILCDGPAALGACCDMQFLDADGEAVCREVPRANCPYPAPGSSLQPAWREGDPCSPDPFNPPCGTAACCRADGSCTNSTESFCAPRGSSWTRGSYCGDPEIACEQFCILSEESCSLPHTTPGCIDPFCCKEICSLSTQAFCCNTAWDAQCASQASLLCGLPPSYDECFAPGNGNGARLIAPGSAVYDADTLNATNHQSDPGFCCNSAGADKKGIGTVWFRFVATATTMRIRTCSSSPPASDSLLQVFEAADASSAQAACATLRSLGCNDDAANCSASGHNSQLCLRNLTVGKTYYAVVAAKDEESRGIYKLTLSASCSDPVPPKCDCPAGVVRWIDPPSGMLDARRPHPRGNSTSLEGISTFLVEGPSGSDRKECWTLCETAIADSSNAVVSATYVAPNQYRLALQRPITAGAVTTLMLAGDPASRGVFYSLPANINGDTASTPADLLDLIDALNGVRFLPWGVFSGDINHSGLLTPADILETIDLLNGVDGFAAWNGADLPDPSPCTGP